MSALVFVGLTVLVVLAGFMLITRHGNKTWTDEEYERERSGGTALGNAFLSAQAILDPGAQKALEQRTVEQVDSIEAEGGDPQPPTNDTNSSSDGS